MKHILRYNENKDLIDFKRICKESLTFIEDMSVDIVCKSTGRYLVLEINSIREGRDFSSNAFNISDISDDLYQLIRVLRANRYSPFTPTILYNDNGLRMKRIALGEVLSRKNKEFQNIFKYPKINNITIMFGRLKNESFDISDILLESNSDIKFIKKDKKKGAKTDTYDVSNLGQVVGQIKWSSRMRGYAFLPTPDCDTEVKSFIKELMSKRREEKKKQKSA